VRKMLRSGPFNKVVGKGLSVIPSLAE